MSGTEFDFWRAMKGGSVISPYTASSGSFLPRADGEATNAMQILQRYPLPQPDGSLIGVARADLARKTSDYAVSRLFEIGGASVVVRGSGTEAQYGWFNTLPRRQQTSVRAGANDWRLET